MSRRPLYKLPNGSWIDPSKVDSILVHPASEQFGLRARVSIQFDSGLIQSVEPALPQEWADKFASLVNEARCGVTRELLRALGAYLALAGMWGRYSICQGWDALLRAVKVRR